MSNTIRITRLEERVDGHDVEIKDIKSKFLFIKDGINSLGMKLDDMSKKEKKKWKRILINLLAALGCIFLLLLIFAGFMY